MKTLFLKTTDAKNVYFLIQTHVPNMKKIVNLQMFFGCIKMSLNFFSLVK